MTPQELSSEEDRFSTSFIGLEEDFYTDLTLETYLNAISRSEPVMPAVESREETSAKHRGRALQSAVKKLAAIELKGKEHVEEYVRCQYRAYCSPNTIRNSQMGLETFLVYVEGTGKKDLQEIQRQDIEGFVEHEQDRGMKLSTVKNRLAIVKAFLRFMQEKGLIGEEVFPWKLKIKVHDALPRAIDPEHVDRLLGVSASERDRAMIMLLLRTGMRIPDILLFGGVVVAPEHEKALRDEVERVKGKYGGSRLPIKWNFKDLKSLYQASKREEKYDRLLKESKAWRKEIFEALADLQFTIIIACIESHSTKRDVIKIRKNELASFVYSNGLMRFGLLVREKRPQRAEVILDWPDQGDPSPFDREYASAYSRGKTIDYGIPYKCGNLCSLNFLDSSVYARMRHSCLLQFSDLILGATREFIECALGKKEQGFGLDLIKIVRSRFRG
jgi:hypothetical protein